MYLPFIIFFPLVASLLLLLVKSYARQFALVASLITLGYTFVLTCNFVPDASMQFVTSYPWIYSLGINFKTGIDGISLPMVLLTNGLMPLIILASFKQTYKNSAAFYALVLFMQAGLLVVFTALDAFLFYVGWEAALIPIYFICALWGGENRIRVNLKFFIYTIFGSLLMLVAIIYLYLQTPGQTYDINAIYSLAVSGNAQSWIFWAFFIAFAIKMPVFPFHTWQPDTYTEAPTAGTMLLAGVMLKMGVYGAIRWLIPVVPLAFAAWGKTAIILAIIGIVYASIIAFTRNDIKRLIAYSSIAHVGLIAAGVFVWNVQSLQGAMIQMLNHGINVVGLFFIADIIIRRLNTRDMHNMGGIAKQAPTFAIAFLLVVMAAVALPLTNSFIGEFLLLLGVYQYSIWAAAISGLTIILGAVYMLRMYQRIMLGPVNEKIPVFADIDGTEKTVLVIIGILILAIGVYPKPLLHLSEAAVSNLVETVNSKLLSTKF
ncbi:NADH-quinone oxidoreductase subunit M (plasmid) [Pedobacter sp. BS3]|uniref:complex I subunit 4 family protein n=1 Tax=Pedobacter sp. BS3 TaxID=2567937 RepID=UPI0011EC71FB|nr:NADH-quinone oxidoreductase subunit M [Pedobacter sp. BS3]TZF86350.1 NADH-quinone oxidoreductase subunit M [Pedobacter sp. BS3]